MEAHSMSPEILGLVSVSAGIIIGFMLGKGSK